MSRRYECEALWVKTGWVGYYQLANRPERIYVTHEGDRLVFGSSEEAKSAAHDAFLTALNRSLISGAIQVVRVHTPAAKAAAEKLFRSRKIQTQA